MQQKSFFILNHPKCFHDVEPSWPKFIPRSPRIIKSNHACLRPIRPSSPNYQKSLRKIEATAEKGHGEEGVENFRYRTRPFNYSVAEEKTGIRRTRKSLRFRSRRRFVNSRLIAHPLPLRACFTPPPPPPRSLTADKLFPWLISPVSVNGERRVSISIKRLGYFPRGDPGPGEREGWMVLGSV